MNSTVDKKEVNHFNKPHQDWWDESGSFSTLHKLTPCRVEYISQVIRRNIINKQMYSSPKVCSDLSILDIGCGGGLLCEPLSRLGGDVTGIDVSEHAIFTAKEHALKMGLEIDYICTSIEELITKKEFDIIIASEVIEHVSDRKYFFKMIKKVSSNNTSFIFTTINKSIPGLIFGKFAAEYLLNLIPNGTHDWNKFVSPQQLYNEALESGIYLNNFSGLTPDIFSGGFKLSSYLGINYAASGIIRKK
jgi:2-polyprenyl-6-hydroxyphenyl methylase/3-demethylubiquinone-9 3-methyltransferase